MSWPARIATLSKGVRLFQQASAGWDFVRGTYKTAAGYVRTNYLYPTETPSAWASTSTSNGVTVSRVATGVEDGLAYADYRWSGTSIGVASDIRLGATTYAAAPGQTWSAAYSAKIIAGSLPTGGVLRVSLIELTSASAYVSETSPAWYPTLSSSAVTRSFSIRTLGGTAGKVQLSAVLGFSSGVAVDVTIRVYAPQLEQTSYPTSFIPTTAAAASVTTYSSTNPADVGNMTFTRASQGYAEDILGNLVSFNANVPRITNKGVLIEEARTNLLLQSQTFDNAPWTKAAGTINANSAVAPDGTLTADLSIPSVVSVDHPVTQSATYTAASYTVSIYAKAGGYDRVGIRENTSTGTYVVVSLTGTGSILSNSGGSPTITLVGNGWYRITMTWTASAISQQLGFYVVGPDYTTGSPHAYSWSGDGTSGVYFWGAQAEAGSFPTSYIPTTSSTVTRAADVFSYGGFVPPSPYSIAAQATISAQTTGFPQMFSLDDGTTSNDAQIYFNAGAPQKLWGLVRVGGVAQAALDMGAASNSTLYVAAMRIAANDFAAVKTGGTVATDVVGSVPATTILRVGSGPATNIWNSYIQRLAIYPFAASDAQLQSISSGNF